MTNQEFTDLYCEALNKIKPIRDKYETLGVRIHLDAHASSGRNYAMNLFASNNNPHLSTLIMFVDGDKYHSFSSKRNCLMIGDASGKQGQFSDSDKKCAENAHIGYMDVDDFISNQNVVI